MLYNPDYLTEPNAQQLFFDKYIDYKGGKLVVKKDAYGIPRMGDIRIDVVQKEGAVGNVHLFDVPYCCGVLFVANLTSWRKGTGRMLLDTVTRFAELSGYSCIECHIPTSKYSDYRRAHQVFKANGFVAHQKDFVNSRTANKIITYVKHIETVPLGNTQISNHLSEVVYDASV